MARKDAKDKKPKYQGYKVSGDTLEQRMAREKRALANARKQDGATVVTNAVFSINDGAFREACRKAALASDPDSGAWNEEELNAAINKLATTRQASKFRNGYGLAYKHRVSPKAVA